MKHVIRIYWTSDGSENILIDTNQKWEAEDQAKKIKEELTKKLKDLGSHELDINYNITSIDKELI